MGRRPKEYRDGKAVIVLDKVGEETDLSLCPICAGHLDCHANIDGHCTALNAVDKREACAFYKSMDANLAAVRRCYQRLKKEGRRDLIDRYIRQMTAMGLLDDDIKAEEQYADILDSFRNSDYQEQLDEAFQDAAGDGDDLENQLLDDSLLDDDGMEAGVMGAALRDEDNVNDY